MCTVASAAADSECLPVVRSAQPCTHNQLPKLLALVCLQAGEVGDYQLYWKNKMKTPIRKTRFLMGLIDWLLLGGKRGWESLQIGLEEHNAPLSMLLFHRAMFTPTACAATPTSCHPVRPSLRLNLQWRCLRRRCRPASALR